MNSFGLRLRRGWSPHQILYPRVTSWERWRPSRMTVCRFISINPCHIRTRLYLWTSNTEGKSSGQCKQFSRENDLPSIRPEEHRSLQNSVNIGKAGSNKTKCLITGGAWFTQLHATGWHRLPIWYYNIFYIYNVQWVCAVFVHFRIK